jgi:hypothetical protein
MGQLLFLKCCVLIWEIKRLLSNGDGESADSLPVKKLKKLLTSEI